MGRVIASFGVSAVLGRRERPLDLAEPLELLRDDRVLVTGASGSIGRRLGALLRSAGVVTVGLDVEPGAGVLPVDVTDASAVAGAVERSGASVVVHLAADKHAPAGEEHPAAVAVTNIVGTRNVVDAAGAVGARVVLASTCKAADPETAYGASKLIAERVTLNAGGTVARFFNVVETAGNVFEIWRSVPASEPLPVSDCRRFFVSAAEAVSLLVWCAALPSGRFVVDPGEPRALADVAAAAFPGRQLVWMPPRRGDRLAEPLCAGSEWVLPTGTPGLLQVFGQHDPDEAAAVRRLAA